MLLIGFEYNYLNFTGELVTARVYYEKNLQADVIGLLDARGAEIATYTYDAWGNVTGRTYVEGNEIPYELNHITYRGYYRDEETGFYYLQSRYYDAEVGRFINADDVNVLGMQLSSTFKDNLYCYCNSNPIMYTDASGYICVADDIAFWGIVIAAIGIIAYAHFISSYQYRNYTQSFYNGIQRALEQTWGWFTSLFKTATQVVTKAVEKSITKAQEIIRKQRYRDYYWIASQVSYSRKRVKKTTYFPCMPITKSKAIVYAKLGENIFASSVGAARRLAISSIR